MGPHLPNRSLGQDRTASLTIQPAHQQKEALAPEPYGKAPRKYFDDQPALDQPALKDKLAASAIDEDQIGRGPTSFPITGASFEPSVGDLVRSISRSSVACRSVCFFPYYAPLSGRHRIETNRIRARLVSSFRSRDIAARMDLREVLSPGDQWSRPDATRSARFARPHTSGVRGIEAEICKPGHETTISTKDHKTKAPTARPHRQCAYPKRECRQLGGEGVSRVLRRRRASSTMRWLGSSLWSMLPGGKCLARTPTAFFNGVPHSLMASRELPLAHQEQKWHTAI